MDLELRKERTNHMRPLASLRILDLTNGNPYPGSLFADYGAEVWKIEPPPAGATPSAAGGAPARTRTGPTRAIITGTRRA